MKLFLLNSLVKEIFVQVIVEQYCNIMTAVKEHTIVLI